MPVQALTSIDPSQFFNLRQISDVEVHGLDTGVSGVTVSNDVSGRLGVMTAEGDRIILTVELETHFRSRSYESRVEADRTAANVGAKYTHQVRDALKEVKSSQIKSASFCRTSLKSSWMCEVEPFSRRNFWLAWTS